MGHEVAAIAGADARIHKPAPAIRAGGHGLAPVVEAVPEVGVAAGGPRIAADQIADPPPLLVFNHERDAGGLREVVVEGDRARGREVGPGRPGGGGVPGLGRKRELAGGAQADRAPGAAVLPEEDPVDLLGIRDHVLALKLAGRLVVAGAPVEVQSQRK